MKSLSRNQTTYYYATYTGKTAVQESNLYTGEYAPAYSAVTKVRDTISVARGNAEDEIFGVNLDYTRRITTTANRPIDEYTAIWICGEVPDISSGAHILGELGIYQGKIYKCIAAYTGAYVAANWEEYPQTHRVIAVGKSLNSTVYAIKEVDIDA